MDFGKCTQILFTHIFNCSATLSTIIPIFKDEFKFKLRDLLFIFSDWNEGRRRRQAAEIVEKMFPNYTAQQYLNNRQKQRLKNKPDEAKIRFAKQFHEIFYNEGVEAAEKFYHESTGTVPMT